MARRRFAVLLGLLVVLGAGGCGEGKDPASPASTASAPPLAGAASPASAAASAGPRSGEPAEPADPRATSRWYEILQDGQKAGWLHVVWAPSTWEGRPTVHDTSRETVRTARRMDRTVDVFETETVTDLERGEDGTLWWLRVVVTEGQGRTTTREVTWRGDGYEEVTTLNGETHRRRIATDVPVFVDAESFVGAKLLAGTAKAGDRLDLPLANWVAQRVDVHTVEVVGPEEAPNVTPPAPATLVRERDPKSGAETLLWMDREGAFAAVKAFATEIRRVPPEVARERPAKPASFSITIPSSPPLERIFSADVTKVDVHLRGDAHRPIPDFPASPFGRVTGVEGDDATGWVVHATLTAHDVPEAKAAFPVTDPAFAKDLEPTLHMPCAHPDVVAAAREAIGSETDARRAVARLSHFVYTTLKKESPSVGETTALEILEQRQGDCSEHALLFVALCRAAGIPARRCTGYVCIGEMWGAHAWAEAWTGAWIGVDPTTDDVGTAARYLLFGRPEDPDSHPGVVSERARGRMRIVTTEVTEGSETVDLRDPESHRVVDREKGTASHRLAGIEMRDVPTSWTVALRGNGDAQVVADGWKARVRAFADQGMRDLSTFADGGEPITFGGAPAVRVEAGSRRTIVFASSRRRVVMVTVEHGGEGGAEALAALEKTLAPTFAMRPGRR